MCVDVFLWVGPQGCDIVIILIFLILNVSVRPPEIDISELESLFSAASASDGSSTKGVGRRGSNINKPEKVQLVC